MAAAHFDFSSFGSSKEYRPSKIFKPVAQTSVCAVMIIFTGKKWSFRISLATLMITLTLSLSAAFLLITRSTLNQVAEQSSDQLFREISDHLVEKVDNLLGMVESVAEAGTFLADATPPSSNVLTQDTLFLFMINALKQNDRLHALFWEDRAGMLVRVVSIRGNPVLREWFGADEKVVYVMRVWDGSGQIQEETHFDAASYEIEKLSSGKQLVVPMRPWRNRSPGNGENQANPLTIERIT